MLGKLLTGLLLMVSILVTPVSAVANSAPVYWQGYPASESMAIEEDSPIAVHYENLSFDFSKGEMLDYSLAGQVTACYNMVNTSKNAHSVTMAFPFVGRVCNLDTKEISITDDGQTVEYKIFLGERATADMAFPNLLSDLSDTVYSSKRLPADALGTLYRFTIYNNSEDKNDEIELSCSFQNKDNIALVSGGFYSYGSDDDGFTLSFSPGDGQVVEIFSLNGSLEPVIKVNQGAGQPVASYCDSTSEKVSLYDYILQVVKQSEEYEPRISDVQYYNMFARELEACTADYGGCIPVVDLLSTALYDRVITLLYTVDFLPEEVKEVAVSYVATGTMDQTDENAPIYKFEYLLEPADFWQDFGTLNVEIKMPEELKYSLKSNLILTPSGGGYQGNFEGLPEENLDFTLQAVAPNTQGGFNMGYSQIFIFSVVGVVLAGLLITSFAGYFKWKKAYQKALKEQESQEK